MKINKYYFLQRPAYRWENTSARETWVGQVSHSMKQLQERQIRSLKCIKKVLSEMQRSSNLLARWDLTCTAVCHFSHQIQENGFNWSCSREWLHRSDL